MLTKLQSRALRAGALLLARVFATSGGSVAPTSIDELFGASLAHVWDNYDAGSGGVWTDRVGGAHGIVNANTPVEGETSTGLFYPSFDGMGTGLHAPDVDTLDGRTSWTIFGAFRTRGNGAYGGLIDKAGAWYIELSFGGGGTIYVGVSNTAGHEISGAIPVGDDELHRFIVTCNAGTLKLFVDGVLDGTDTGVIAIPATANPVLLGKQPSGDQTTESDIPMLGIATRGLSDAEVALLDGFIAADVGTLPALGGAAPVLSSMNHDQGDTLGGGASIVLTGSGFTGATDVKFDTTSATGITVDSDTQITCTLPAHAAGVVDVTVVGPGGTSNALSFEYWDPTEESAVRLLYDCISNPYNEGADTWTPRYINPRVTGGLTGVMRPYDSFYDVKPGPTTAANGAPQHAGDGATAFALRLPSDHGWREFLGAPVNTGGAEHNPGACGVVARQTNVDVNTAYATAPYNSAQALGNMDLNAGTIGIAPVVDIDGAGDQRVHAHLYDPAIGGAYTTLTVPYDAQNKRTAIISRWGDGSPSSGTWTLSVNGATSGAGYADSGDKHAAYSSLTTYSVDSGWQYAAGHDGGGSNQRYGGTVESFFVADSRVSDTFITKHYKWAAQRFGVE